MKLSTMAGIFGLLAAAGTGQAQKGAAASWRQFADPLERAFTIDVPAGWTVRGGLYRKGVLDPRIMVDVTSPDGRITYRIGDAGIPPYTIPTAMGMQLGFREGAPYNPGGRVQGMIARYRNGPQFANLYAQTHYSKLCRNVAVKSMRPASPIMRVGMTSDNAGEVVFSCEAGGPMAGYVYAQSSLSGSMRDGLWGIPVIFSFLAPQAQAKQALELMLHSVASYHENPQWTQSQLAMIRQANGQIQQEAQGNLDTARRQRQRTDTQLKLAEDFDDVINGVTLTHDPDHGQTREVVTSANPYYWANPNDSVVSTRTDNQPGPNYHRVQTTTRGQQ